jgi:tRNA(fMet)-specific endonuclease VapC
MKNILLDTNAYARLIAGEEQILNIISAADRVFMSIFVLGELYSGFRGGNRMQENNEILFRFLHKTSVETIDGTAETAEIFGELKDSLRKAGTPIPINDIWIAAHAIEFGAVIVSYDKHFSKIPQIRLSF